MQLPCFPRRRLSFPQTRDVRRLFPYLVAIVLFALICASPVPAVAQGYTPPVSNRVDFNFNYDWLFTKANVSGANGGTSFNDSAWTQVSLPHTWNNDKFREWIFLTNATPQDPLLPSGTYYGIAWYRKHFTIPSTYSGRKLILEFQGIGRVGTFYVNGQYVGINESGVAPVGIDITPYVTFGQDNVIAVEVNNNENYQTLGYNGAILPFGQPFNPNFGGLNRDVTLHICDLLHQTFPLYRNLGTVGTYVYPSNINTLYKNAGLTIQTQVENDYSISQNVTCSAAVVDNSGNVVLSATATPQTFTAGQISTITMTGSMTNIHFWEPDYPYLYTVYTTLSVNGNVLDVYQTPLGVRTFVFNPAFGLEVNGHPLYLNGYSPRCSMEWPCVGTPVDWMNELDFKMMKDGNANFVRPMHIAPRMIQVEAADKFGIVMVCPAANNEGDDTDPNIWQERLDDMRDVTIYYRNNPSVYFYEGCNQILSAQHMSDMLNVRLTWDPYGGRLAGCRSNDTSTTFGIREYSCTMDGAGTQTANPLWDAEYARGECPRRVWDEYTPMLNPRWNGVNSDPTPAVGTVDDTTHKYLLGGYFYIASDYHQAFGLNSGTSDFIGDFLVPSLESPTTAGYFRLQTSEDMVLENLAKYYARFERSNFVQPVTTSTTQGVMVGGGKIIWSDSVTDGRMHDTEVTRVSGAVDGARLPKELYYALQVVQSSSNGIYIIGHWNYAAGTVKTVYVVSNSPQVDLQTYDANGNLIKDYGLGTRTFFPTALYPSGGDEVNGYVFSFPNVAYQPGAIKALAYSSTSPNPVATAQKSTVGPPVALRITPTVGPSGNWMADGSDIAMFDVEAVDANGNRCPTYEDTVTFSCSGTAAGVFLGGYNSGKRYSTNLANLTSGYSLNLECGINRLFVRSTRAPGQFTLNVTGSGLTPASASVTSVSVADNSGLSTVWPQLYTVPLGTEPTPVAGGSPPPPPSNAPSVAPATNIVDLHYSGGNQDQAVLVENLQSGMQVYKDQSGIAFGSLPNYLIGGEYIQAFQSDAGETAATDQYQFDLTDYSYIYLLMDAANAMPDNDNNSDYQWQELNDTVVINGRTMNIYKSRLMAPYENGYLADNGYGNSPFDPYSNMYVVVVVSAEEQLQNPADTITASTTQASYNAPLAIDANTTTRWNASSGVFPQSVILDLGKVCNIGGFDLNWYTNPTRYYQYKLEVSTDGTNYNLSLDNTANVTKGDAEYRVPALNSGSGRWIRVTVNGATAGAWAAINEMRINGVPASLTGTAVPIITSPLTASGSGGGAFTYQIQASNSPVSYNAQGLPSGLTINGVTGMISGATLLAGTFPITITGINSAGPGSAVLMLAMTPPPPVPVITSGTLLSAVAAVAMPTYQTVATNSPTSYSATGLPTGLSINATTGAITGTPKYPGTYLVTLQATNNGGPGTAQLTINVAANGAPPTITSAAMVTGTASVALTYQIVATGAASLYSATGLPGGLSVSTATGAITGTPTLAGTYSATVTAENAGGTATTTIVFKILINPNAPVITSVLTGTGGVGVGYSYSITATNNPTTYSATGLPAGLALTASTGIIAGTPTTGGTYSVTIQATNTTGAGGALLALTILPAGKAPVITSGTNEVGDVALALTWPIVASNNPTAYTATSLPTGLLINGSTGLVSGTPTSSGTFIATVVASNFFGSGSAACQFVIGPAGADYNLALYQPVTVSSVEVSTNSGPNAVDGSLASRWESQWSDPQWIYVDLGTQRMIHGIVLNWENAAGKNYDLQVSDDAQSWLESHAVTGNTASGVLTYPGINTAARYVRMSGSTRTTGYGYSLWEFMIMGIPLPASSNIPAITSATSASVITGSALSYQIIATNSSTTYSSSALPSGLTLNSTTGLISGTLTASGTFSVTLGAGNSQGIGTSALSITGALTPYAAWQSAMFSGSNLANSSVSSDLAAPAGDGIPNLLKYALNLNPMANCLSGLPQGSTATTGSGNYLTLTYTQVISATDITYQPQVSSDLQTWYSGPNYLNQVQVTNNADGVTQTVIVQDKTPIGNGHRFIRLQVTGP